MKLFTKLAFGLLFASISLSACALDDRTDHVDLVDEVETATALQVGDVAPIKTVAALHRYLENTLRSPLDRLAPDAKQRFLRSLSFSKDGVSGFQYSELSSLSASEVHQILSMFGLERTAARIKPAPGATAPAVETNGLPGDRFGYRCSGRGTCTTSPESICTPTCWNGGNPTFPF